MTTLLVESAKAVGANLVNAAGQYAVSTAVSAVADLFDNRRFEGPRMDGFHLQTSRDGAPMPRVFGRVRLAGQVIWASKVREIGTETRPGGKGGPRITNYNYTINFAVGLCEGEILDIGRVWANGAELERYGINMRVYTGREDQQPDPIIQATEGPNVPAFRGTAYVVFENFPLDEYGARLPQLSFEVQRIPSSGTSEPRLEHLVKSVCLLPSSGEFAYATTAVESLLGAGRAEPVNVNNLSGRSDIERALDQLQAQLPNCRHVSLILSWFGTDLRLSECEFFPGVEHDFRTTVPLKWSVAGENRASAYLVSKDEQGRAVFGGTPSDNSVLQAIAALKFRGFEVTIYPFILMDIPSGNGLPNPYDPNTEQPVFPWRGRITCHPAPDQAGTPNQTVTIQSQVDQFFGREAGYRRFILHYAELAARSEGVDNFIIGSELRALTTLRDHENGFPFVNGLKRLAGDVRAIVGADTKLTYAADWSEYFGYQPASGDVFFHLDSLWADPAIDAIGIDSYMPLSDWRDGSDHLDAAMSDTTYELDYLQSNMQGGEGYDWFYASPQDRENQTRTPITDGLGGTPWIYRYKDIWNWWSNPHHNRIGGEIQSNPTDWQPQSKPIWITELGCPAIDKGANQPNVFVDPKSSESFTPYHSNGERDDLIQRRYIEAYLDYVSPDQGHNPISTIYNAPMIDPDKIIIWTWDARPFPDFPARDQVWSDGENWQFGHWINGRTGLVPLADVITDVTRSTGLVDIDTSRVIGLVEGFVIDRPMSARAALEPLSLVFGLSVFEQADALSFVSQGLEHHINLSPTDIIGEARAEFTISRSDSEASLRDVRLQFIESGNDFQPSSVAARNITAETRRVLDVAAPLVMPPDQARLTAQRILRDAHETRETLTMSVSPATIDLEVGDVLSLGDALGQDRAKWQVQEMDQERSHINITARRWVASEGADFAVSGSLPNTAAALRWVASPHPLILDIADYKGRELTDNSGPLVTAQLTPFAPVLFDIDNSSSELSAPPVTGVLQTLLGGDRTLLGRYDYANSFEIKLDRGELSSVDQLALLSGENHFAVQTQTGWEILAAQNIELIAPATYRLSKLLRGLMGSDADMMEEVPSGATIVLLSELPRHPISNDLIGEELSVQASAAGRSSDPISITYKARHLRPLSPVHGRYDEGSGTLTWIRRSRVDGDKWTGLDIPLGEARELYRVRLWQDEALLLETEVNSAEFTVEESLRAQVTHFTVAQASEAFGFGVELLISAD